MNSNRDYPVDFSCYGRLPRVEARLISGWFNRSLQKLGCHNEEAFDAFISVWVAFNGWAACVTGISEPDSKIIKRLKQDEIICHDFEKLLTSQDSDFSHSVAEFAKFWPIFKVQDLRTHHIILDCTQSSRQEIVSNYLAKGIKRYYPQSWTPDRGAAITWPNTLDALYRVRCNLFHGEKALSCEMDQEIVADAFHTLVYFLKEAKYLDRRSTD